MVTNFAQIFTLETCKKKHVIPNLQLQITNPVYVHIFTYWEIANFAIFYGFLNPKGQICKGLLYFCDLRLRYTNTNEKWECSSVGCT
jgi:hypothetical protein